MLLRQKSGGFYAHPNGLIRRLLWKLGFDPLTVYERLKQVDTERANWKEDAKRYAQNAAHWEEKSDG